MKILDVPQSGSLAGQTSSRNRFGQYRRTRAIPVNPNTPAQSDARGWLSTLSQQWRALTAMIQDSWNAYGDTVTRTDSLGQTYTLTGQQAFIDVNIPKLLIADVIVVNPPVGSITAPTLGVDSASIGAGVAITIDPDPIPANRHMVIFSSPPLSLGRTFNNDFRFVAALDPAETSPYAIAADLEAKFGTLMISRRYFLKAYLIDDGTAPSSGVRSAFSTTIQLDTVA